MHFLKPTLKDVSQDYVLVQAGKKSANYIRYHNWLADTLELDYHTANLPDFLQSLSEEIQSGQWRSEPSAAYASPRHRPPDCSGWTTYPLSIVPFLFFISVARWTTINTMVLRVSLPAFGGKVLSENSIINVAVHDLRRVGDVFELALGNSELKVTKPVQRVVDQLHSLYGRRTSKSHGKFSDDEDNYPTQRHLKEYVETEQKHFDILTEALMKTLQMHAQTKAAATGGHVFFAHFRRDERHYLMVAIVNDTLGAALTNQHDVQDVTHLDVEGFRFAGRINITAWLDNQDRYIGFLRGKGNVAEYFQSFLGCADPAEVKADTRNLVEALKGFADKKKLDPDARTAFLSKAKEICDRAASQREELSFDALSNELTPDDPEALREHLADPDLLLNDRFIPNKAILNSLVRFKGRTNHWAIEFDREAIRDGEVVYDPGKQTITLRNLPDELKQKLGSEFENG